MKKANNALMMMMKMKRMMNWKNDEHDDDDDGGGGGGDESQSTLVTARLCKNSDEPQERLLSLFGRSWIRKLLLPQFQSLRKRKFPEDPSPDRTR